MCGCKKKRNAVVVPILKDNISSNIVAPEITYGDLRANYSTDVNNGNFISARQIANGNMKTNLYYLWCIDMNSLIKAFASRGFTIKNKSDLDVIANAYNNGSDVYGIKDPNTGVMVKLNTKDIVDNIEISSDKFKNGSCEIKYSVQ